MEIAVVEGAKRYDKFVADFLSQASTLRKTQVMGVRWLAIANQARKLCHTPEVVLVPDPAFNAEPELRLIDSRPLRKLGRLNVRDRQTRIWRRQRHTSKNLRRYIVLSG